MVEARCLSLSHFLIWHQRETIRGLNFCTDGGDHDDDEGGPPKWSGNGTHIRRGHQGYERGERSQGRFDMSLRS